MLKSSLCDYRDAYKFVSGTIIVPAQAWDNQNNGDK